MYRFALTLVLLLLSGCAAAQTSSGLSGREALRAALAEREGAGGVLALAGGEYGSLPLGQMVFTAEAPLVLRAADPADPPVFTGLWIEDSAHIRLDGLVFDYRFEAGDDQKKTPFRIVDSANIAVVNSLFDGDLARGTTAARDGYPTGYGLRLRGVQDILIQNNEIRDFLRGILVGRSRGLTIRGNDIHSMRSDGLTFAQVQDVLIEGNHIHDFARAPGVGDHADMIQFWTARTHAPSTGITIRRNLLNSGGGGATQSIFMRNEEVDRGRAGAEMFYRDILIEENFILNAHLHGITVGETDGLTIRRNTVLRNPASVGERPERQVWIPRIGIKPTARNVTVTDNVMDRLAGPDGQADWTVGNNLFVQDEARMRPYFYNTVFAGGPREEPASYRPLPGGPLDGTGLGAPVEVYAR